MRIVHLTQYFLPWLGYQEYYLPREQARMGHEVTVLASNLRWPEGNYAVLSEAGEPREMPLGLSVERGVPCVRLAVRRRLRGRLVLAGVGQWLSRLRPEVVIAHLVLVPHTFQAAALTRRLGFRLVVDEHQLPSQAAPGALHRVERRGVALAARALVYPRVHRFVAVAPGAVDWLVGEYGVPAERVTFIPLGVDTDVFFPDPAKRAAVRAALGIAEEEFLVVYTGKIAPYKRVETVIEAAARARARGVPAVCATIGHAEPEYLHTLRILAQKQRVPLHTPPAAPAEALAGYFNAADLCAWPADCTISHLEAAACGRPIAIAADARVEDRIAAGNGVAIPPGDAGALAAFLESLWRDPARRREMGERGAAHVEEHYGWRAVALSFEQVAG